uniref:WW domain-containing protein n=1 Tax=Anopheles epiroticus TaxID=199890 RepID=A0A182PMS8_9DIPT
YSKQVKAYYYYDRTTKKSQWEHPIDVLYRAKVIEARKALAFDQSDSTSFGDSGFRSFKSSNNHSANDQSYLKSADGAGSFTDYKSNHDVIKLNRLEAPSLPEMVQFNATGISTTLGNEESDSNKENNSQESAICITKNKDGFEPVMALAKRLSINTAANDHDTNESLQAVKSVQDNKRESPVHGFTITGTGSQFLKSNKKLDNGTQDLARKRDSEMKGILRDTSLTHIRSKSVANDDSGNDERKSVRFDIDINEEERANESKTEKETSRNLKSPYNLESNAAVDNDGDNVNDEDDNEDEIVTSYDEVEERVEHHERENDGVNAGNIMNLSSSETSEQDSEILTGVGFVAINNEGKNVSTAKATPVAVSKDLLGECDLDTVRNLRQAINQERENFAAKLEEELRVLSEQEEMKMKHELEKEHKRYEALLSKEKQHLKDLHQQNLDEIKDFYQVKLTEMKADYEEENAKEYAVYQETLQEEFDRRVKEVTDLHRATMATLQKNHDEIVEELERDLKMEEELLKKEHNTKLSEMKIKLNHELDMERQRMRETGEDRLYEKVRCEKRLLEDKYKCLKEKYTRLKTDVRISLERRKKRREQQQQQQHHSLLSNSYETDDRTNSKPLPSYSYEIGKGISIMSEKSTLSNLPQVAGSKRLFAAGDSYAMDTKHNAQNLTENESVDPRKSPSVLHHNHNNNNNNNNNYNQTVDNSNQSEPKYSKHYFQVKRIFANTQHEDNFSSDSEFHKISCDNGGLENSCSSTQTAAVTTASRPKRRIFTKTKSSSTSKLNSSKHEREPGIRPCTPVENLRIQLKKLEELEDQIPDCNLDTPYHLRYPFINSINSVESSDITSKTCVPETSRADGATVTDRSEIEFFKHRILLERDSVMRAKESLRLQKNLFKSKQRDVAVKHASQNKQTMDLIFQEEKELTEMEVSLHRTRALLGEKVIRLRHLENSLKKLAEKDPSIRPTPKDMPFKPKETLSDLSSYSSSGFSSTEVPTTEHHYDHLKAKMVPSNAEGADTLFYLKHLHTEIQEIWSLLNPNNGTLPMKIEEMDFLNNTASATSSKQFCDIVLPPRATTPTFNQVTAACQTKGPQPMTHFIQNQHHCTISLLEKTRDLKNWLRQAKNEHEILKKQ